MAILYTLWQCTWGLLQTLAGLAVFLVNVKEPHFRCHGAIGTHWRGKAGVSLGLFIFVPKNCSSQLVIHEYGHTVQSLLLGPLYLLVIGLPSIFWAGVPALKRRRQRLGKSYYSFYTERWANAWGEKVTGQQSVQI